MQWRAIRIVILTDIAAAQAMAAATAVEVWVTAPVMEHIVHQSAPILRLVTAIRADMDTEVIARTGSTMEQPGLATAMEDFQPTVHTVLTRDSAEVTDRASRCTLAAKLKLSDANVHSVENSSHEGTSVGLHAQLGPSSVVQVDFG